MKSLANVLSLAVSAMVLPSGIDDGVGQQDGRTVLPVVRRRALLSLPDGDEAERRCTHRQRLCRLLPPQFPRAAGLARRCAATRKSPVPAERVYVGPSPAAGTAGMQKM